MQFKSKEQICNKLTDSLFTQKKVVVYVKRDEILHPILGGNKFRKLKANISFAVSNKIKTLITFGGPYSNHIAATALAGKLNGIKTVGIIRGDELKDAVELNNTLAGAIQNEMELKFISRQAFSSLNRPALIQKLKLEFDNCLIIPEGGANHLANEGLAEIVSEISDPFDFIVCPVGTGSTLFGIAQCLNANQKIIGIDVLKRETLNVRLLFDRLTGNVLYHQPNHVEDHNLDLNEEQVILNSRFHFGGYAKSNEELLKFCEIFSNTHSINIEPVYSGKMFYGMYQLIREDFFKPGSQIVALHTGGLQYLSRQFS